MAAVAIVSVVFLAACNKSASIENPVGSQSVSLDLTDAPGVFDDEDFVEVRAELVVQFRY